MNLYITLFSVFFFTILFIIILKPIAKAINLIDDPGGRKKHKYPTPITGGIAMFTGLFLGVLLNEIFTFSQWLLMGSSLLIIIGIIDDRFNLSARTRLIAQIFISLLVISFSSNAVENTGSSFLFNWNLGVLSYPITILIIITIINAFNAIDGIDGLSGGVAFTVFGLMAYLNYNHFSFELILLLMASIFGFLLCNIPFNFNKKIKCFMGDGGSTFLGFSIIWLGINTSQGDSASIFPVTGLWLVSLPVFDFAASLLRRAANKKSVFSSDREHLHYILIDAGFSTNKTLFLILTINLAISLIGIIGQLLMISEAIMFLLWLFAGIIYYQCISLFLNFRSCY